MAKERKRRKKDFEEGHADQAEPTEAMEAIDETPRKRVKKRKSEVNDPPKKESKKSKQFSNNHHEGEPPKATTSKVAPLSSIQFSSLQSIFATKDADEPTFTLFGANSPTRSPSPAAVPVPSIPLPQHLPSTQVPKDVKLFFPHYENPDLNAQSQFAESDEPFFHDQTMYDLAKTVSDTNCREEKRRIWMETRYEFTQDWKKKRRASMKIKRRREIRRTV